MRYWAECREFFGQFRQQYQTTGSILPSSRALGRALTKPMRKAHGPRRILEVGPGTGAVTAEITRALGPEDRLDIVEINNVFVEVINKRFAEEPGFRRCRTQAHVIHAPLQEVPGDGLYDFMISGLPLNNFPVSLVEEIFASYRRLLKHDGILSYFEYAGVRDLKKIFVRQGEQERLRDLSKYLENVICSSQVAIDFVPCNVPPALARHCQFK